MIATLPHILKPVGCLCLGAAFLLVSMMQVSATEPPRLHQIGPVLDHPWGMDFISADEVLVTERGGALYRINITNGATKRISNVPAVVASGQGGLLDVMVARGLVYLCYAKMTDTGIVTAIERASLSGARLYDRTTIFQSNTPSWSNVHFGCRLAMGNGHLFASLGERGKRDNAQNAAIHDGSIIRLMPDGSIPTDNPKRTGWAAEIYSIGHRNPQGMAAHSQTGEIWTHEHGPKGGDEINIIKAGENYGWPRVSHGNEYRNNQPVSDHNSLAGMNDPEWVWIPSIAPSGMAFYPAKAANGEDADDDDTKIMFPELAGTLLVGSLKFRQLYVVTLDGEGMPSREQIVMGNVIGRIRDVAVASDGSILLLNDAPQSAAPPGGLYRVSQ